MYSMWDCLYLLDQTGRSDFAGTAVFMYVSLFTLLEGAFPTTLVLGDWAICVDHDVMWLDNGFEEHLYFCSFLADSRMAWTHQSNHLCFLRAWVQWHRTNAGLTFCLPNQWFSSCQFTSLFFLDSTTILPSAQFPFVIGLARSTWPKWLIRLTLHVVGLSQIRPWPRQKSIIYYLHIHTHTWFLWVSWQISHMISNSFNLAE